MHPLVATSVAAIGTLVVFGGGALVLVAMKFWRGFRDPDSRAGDRSMLTRDYTDKQFKKPPDESRLL